MAEFGGLDRTFSPSVQPFALSAILKLQVDLVCELFRGRCVFDMLVGVCARVVGVRMSGEKAGKTVKPFRGRQEE